MEHEQEAHAQAQPEPETQTEQAETPEKAPEKSAEPEHKPQSLFSRLTRIVKEKDAPEAPKKESEEKKAARQRLMDIRDRMMTLKWDAEHGQINPAKKAKYTELKEEYDKLVAVLEKD